MRKIIITASIFAIFLIFALPSSALASDSPRGYYRFPALHNGGILFCAEGDLWTVDLLGGGARRLTTHAEEESHPVVSPDGLLVAFTAAYEGPHEIYVMPVAGGRPTRLTHEGVTSRRRKPRPVSWTAEGHLLYSTQAYSTLPNWQLVQMDPSTTQTTLIPLAQASDGVYDPIGKTLFFTRLPFQGSYAKRYQGGTAQNVWSLTRGDDEARLLTRDDPGTSKHPQWWDGRIYFISDRDGAMNIWSMEPDGGQPRQHTFHEKWDVKEASVAQGRVVYRLGADLRLLDIASKEDRQLDITLASDFDQTRETWVQKPFDYLTAVHLSPEGDRLVLTARGEIFVAPVGAGRLAHVTRNPGVRYRQGRFMPDGQSLMALSDESGEVEWWRLSADGVGAAEAWTQDGKVLRYNGTPSPDGKWIVSDDHRAQLWLSEIATGQSWKIASSPSWGIDGVASWSPDNRWFAYSITVGNQLNRIYIASVENRQPVALTTDRYHSYSPIWSPDGRWIYFLSNRHFRSLVESPWGNRTPDPFFDKKTKIFAVSLADEAQNSRERFPFAAPNELQPPASATSGLEDSGMENGETKGGEEKDDKNNDHVVVRVEASGLMARLHEVPVPPGNYSSLSMNEKRLFWLASETTADAPPQLMTLEISSTTSGPKVLANGVLGYELSLDGKKILVRRPRADPAGGENFHVVDAAAPVPLNLDQTPPVDLSHWTFSYSPREAWRQMFVDAWRLHRDYFYDRGMHGINWPAVREKYLPLVERVTSRGDLSDILGQMISELSALHATVRRGDFRQGGDQVPTAFLGARLKRDQVGGGYRIEHIYRADPDLPAELSPLARPGLGTLEGHVLVAVNGVSTLERPPGASLRHQAGQQVRLRVKPSAEGPERDIIVTPIGFDRARDLRYDEWEYTRRLAVEKQSKSTIGYVHLRAMGSDNIGEWQREFPPIYQRQGLIVDVRHNPGGNIDSWILGKLLRQAWMYWQGPSGEPYSNMQQVFRGHMVVLVNERTGSDGEAFAEGFRRLGLGPVIGTRTWGGEIWLTGSNVLVDNGVATAAEFGVYGPEGTWLIEGHGVDPDIVVDNPPRATFGGEDAQLDAAIAHLLEKIRQDPRPIPAAPDYPDMSERKPN